MNRIRALKRRDKRACFLSCSPTMRGYKNMANCKPGKVPLSEITSAGTLILDLLAFRTLGKKKICCLNHSDCGILLWQHELRCHLKNLKIFNVDDEYFKHIIPTKCCVDIVRSLFLLPPL